MDLDESAVSSCICGCHDPDLVTSMLTYLAQTDCYFTDSQRGVADPSMNDKIKIAHETLHKSPQTFLTRYGGHINRSHKQYFYQHFVRKPDGVGDGMPDNLSGGVSVDSTLYFRLAVVTRESEVNVDDRDLIYQLKLLDKDISDNDTRVKNRRFTAMRQLMKDSDYFSDEQIKHRDPLLYEQMIGQYLTDSEIQDQSAALLRNHCGLSSVLFEQMESKENEALYQRQLDRQQSQLEESDSSDEEEEEQTEEETEPTGATQVADEDRLALREEFLHIMQERFLSGADAEFDYSSVDRCTDYDDLKQEGEDAQEKYFDDDEDEVADGSTPQVSFSTPQVSSLAPDEYDY